MVFTTLVPVFGNSLFSKIRISEFHEDIKKSLLSDLKPYVGSPKKIGMFENLVVPTNRAHKLKSVIGIYAQHIRKTGLKLVKLTTNSVGKNIDDKGTSIFKTNCSK